MSDSNEDGDPTMSRRSFLKRAGTGVAAAGLGSMLPLASPYGAHAQGDTLKVLQWSHFVPHYDEWFPKYANQWGRENGVDVNVDTISIADLPATTSSEISAGSGHDLIEIGSYASQYQRSLVDLTDVNQEARSRWGEPFSVPEKVSKNPINGKYYAFCHGWVIDPGDYRKSLWRQAGKPHGPESWADLLEYGGEIWEQQGVQVGIGCAQEYDSNMVHRVLLWAFDTSVQDEYGRVILDQGTFKQRTIEALKYFNSLFERAMTPEIFAWNAASNNQTMIAGRSSFILNSISAYRSAQKDRPGIAKDIFFAKALKGPRGTGWNAPHILFNYVVPKFSDNIDTAKAFILDLQANYHLAMYNSELYNSPSFFGVSLEDKEWGNVPDKHRVRGAETLQDVHNAWFDDDPFRLPGEAKGKLKTLKNAQEWTTNLGHPGYASPAVSEAFNTYVIPNMFTRVLKGEHTPEESVEQAGTQLRDIWSKWRDRGLVQG